MGTLPSAIPELKRRYHVSFPGVFENETPAHLVTLHEFRMDHGLVTNGMFDAFVTARSEWRRESLSADRQNGHYLEHWRNGQYPADKADHPVVFVTWHAAQAYCQWAGGRLPSEAEWEYAARAGGDREFPWGDSPPTGEMANFWLAGRKSTTPVRSYPPSVWGLFDLAGNVWEFLLDLWEPYHSRDPELDPIAGGEVPEEKLLSIGGRRSIRGGSFAGSSVNLRTRWRDSHGVLNAVEFVGFRCAYSAVN
jgi:formylglycine-generating enzyme required for sulfatase activity